MISETSLCAHSYHTGIEPLRGPLTLRRIFTRAWQLQTPDGWIITVAALPYNGPLGIRVPTLDSRHLSPGTTGMLVPDALIIGPIRVSLDGALAWRPSPPGHAAPVLPSALAADVQRLKVVDEGFSPLPGCQHARCSSPVAGEQPDVSAQRAKALASGDPAGSFRERERYGRGICLLTDAITAGDEARMRDAALLLLGLGPGLTPSGDDLLCGVLAGLHVLGTRRPQHNAWAERIGAILREIVEGPSPTRTTALSRTLLHWAARGVTAEPLHDVLCTLGSGTKVRGLSELLGIGHHSGADMLAGALLAAGALLEQEEASGEALVRAAERLP